MLRQGFKCLNISRKSSQSNSFFHWLVLMGKAVGFNPLSANPTKWWNTRKQFVGKLPTNCLSVFDHFMGLALEGSMGKAF